MKLIVTDHADPSVGMFQQTWEVDCPFTSDSDKETLEYFRNQIVSLYKEFGDGYVEAIYDFEFVLSDFDIPNIETDLIF